MARIFITGSTDGIGLRTAACPGAEAVLVGDLSSLAETKTLAAEASRSGKFDCIIHNAGVYRGQDNVVSRDTGFPRLFCRQHARALDTMPRGVTYSDSKLHNTMLAKYFARHGVEAASSVGSGWVPTKMGGRSAPDSTGAAKTAASGAYFVNSREASPQAVANDEAQQDALVAELAKLSGDSEPLAMLADRVA
ncbi:hypothetical protein SCUCBS95973_008715 [Sporothrix curviconia]|uniref:Short chain dehydrogenase n=1 Tax=Sporothrix curviconia TaxID=1260050 RepID=A0ABP0CQD9_9PEZI